jgi:hypothetical protein
MKRFFFIPALVFLFSCTDTATENSRNEGVHAAATDTLPVGAKPIMLAGCYAMENGKDTIRLSVQLRDSTVSGSLVYKLYEKDSNYGTIKGVLRDSLIIADYTFRSEGTTSVREVIFKVQPDQLLEATGPRTERNGRVIYTHPNTLDFSALPPLRKNACQ